MCPVSKDEVRPVSAAGLFYPADPVELATQIERLLAQVEVNKPGGEIKALISPHAGYVYSGQVAAAGYSCLNGLAFDVIVIISPSHNENFSGVSVFTGKGYDSPLGLVPVATDLAEALIASDTIIHASWQGHRDEHALEVQLPFLQKVIDNFTIIPVVMGHQDMDTALALGTALANILEKTSSLVVASSDLSHSFAYPAACDLDQTAAQLIEELDEKKFVRALKEGQCQACGWGPIVSAMVAGKKNGAQSARVCLYQNSGDVTGDHSRVVGYLSALIYKNFNQVQEVDSLA